MSEWPETLVEKVANGLGEHPLIDPENGNEWFLHEWFSPGAIREFATAALDALGLREQTRWTAVGVRGDRQFEPRSRADAEDLMRQYPPEWTYFGEEDDGPNGLSHLEGERRFVFETPWEDA